MTREWKHLKMLKRSGFGHDPLGVDNVSPGACALICPACPQPGKNMPPNWENTPRERQSVSMLAALLQVNLTLPRFLHTLMLGLDANFRLKRKAVSNEVMDPALGSGLAYLVDSAAYKQHLEKYIGVKEVVGGSPYSLAYIC